MLKMIRRKYNRWRRFSREERGLIIKAWLLLPVMVLGLRLAGLQRFQQFLRSQTPAGSVQNPGITNNDIIILGHSDKIQKMIRIAARYSLVPAKCLPKSLLLWWLLKRSGIESDLRLGVQKDKEKFEAHAWVEYKGTVLNDSPQVNERYTTFNSSLIDISKVQ